MPTILIDESHRLFYLTVINVSEREVAYVIDGLMHNDVIESDIHSTDTHGYSEMIFGVTHLLGISFAPRIKDIKDQKLYSFESKSKLNQLGYQLLPDGKSLEEMLQSGEFAVVLLCQSFCSVLKSRCKAKMHQGKRATSISKRHTRNGGSSGSKTASQTPQGIKLLESVNLLNSRF